MLAECYHFDITGVTPMAQILIRGLDPKTVEALKQRAKLNGRSLQSEAKRIIERESGLLSVVAALDDLAATRASLRKRFSDSTAIIRKDRAR